MSLHSEYPTSISMPRHVRIVNKRSYRFEVLGKSDPAVQLPNGGDLAKVPIFNDQELKDAIEELERSTAAISKQTESLRQQHDALGRLVRESQETAHARTNLEARQSQKWESEQKAVVLAVEEIAQSLSARITDTSQQIKASGNDVQSTTEKMLQLDDKLLSSLQKLGWEIQTEDPEELENVTKLREICARLVKSKADSWHSPMSLPLSLPCFPYPTFFLSPFRPGPRHVGALRTLFIKSLYKGI
jgi:hypothetical protein